MWDEEWMPEEYVIHGIAQAVKIWNLNLFFAELNLQALLSLTSSAFVIFKDFWLNK